ncbi:SNF2 family protein, putative [Plasmodium knowlesi strain H]|uniref:SNF2 family protein, putative n=3 Tax=Plasmodium knowlesi TaxID=5850 RepID=A0A5K1VJQ2_PLAKH|nr:DNA helicase, putative [Plasmodium knowlesi strain H]OTN68128.1 putative SNF2 family protein [Plasmodium knowlesi]CAA9986899.1 DNA helicase, putative [Plasmodium knowlesi strain H]SBO26546.1 SNF2 family protein, putative [Plasmodium knowlesi strain H]SBO28103.1 SNF2 family protein, putative [Plasmodium knowlesi strain H]VVS76373.1 DNA helicase, putative [Plasmodium knowlesi strain H]|eukprot:XP_002258144.1 SNF2-family protein, putative [Plasmodium knowlesi strain H]
MDVFEFVEPLRKRKITNNLFDFDQYVYKEKVDESEEKKSEHHVVKKKKKKLRRVLDSSNSEGDNNKSNEDTSPRSRKKRNGPKDESPKKEYEDEEQKHATPHQQNESNTNSDDHDSSLSNQEEYEQNLKDLFECILGSIKIKNKIIEYFTSNVKEKRQEIIKDFVKGSFRVSNFDANFTNFEKDVDTFHKLKKYQKCGVFWLYVLYKENKNGILADEMGLGKTAQTCVFLDYMYRTKELKNKTIIVAPTSLLKNWNNEINMWCPYLKNHKIIYYGSQNERKYLAYDIFTNKSSNIHIIVTSVNMLIGKNDVSYFRQIKKYDYLIFDEAHFLKNKNSLVYKKLQKKISFNNKILLTGSPIQNKTQELMNLLLFLMPDIFTEKSINSAMNAFVKMYQDILESKENDDHNNLDCCGTPRNSAKNMDIYDIKSVEKKEPMEMNDSTNGNAITTEDTRNIIKNYLIETIKDDVKYAQLKNKEIILLQLIIEPYILRRSKKHVFIDMPKKHSIIIKLPMNTTQLNLYKDEIMSKIQHTHKHLEFLSKHSNKKELEKLAVIFEKKDIKLENIFHSRSNGGDGGDKESDATPSASNRAVDLTDRSVTEAATEASSGGTHNGDTSDHVGNTNEKGGIASEGAPAEEPNEYDDEDDKIDEKTINIEKAEENKDGNIVINKRQDEPMEKENANNISKEVRGRMINASIFILRRICNHPLLHKYYYSVEDIKKISKYFYTNTDQYLDLDLKTVENEFMKISDFDIHLSIKHLISQGDENLNRYLISKDHILNSSKIHHMISLIKDIRKKKEKVLIFSQFTTFLDIIEEALLYEFVYDEQDFSHHQQCVTEGGKDGQIDAKGHLRGEDNVSGGDQTDPNVDATEEGETRQDNSGKEEDTNSYLNKNDKDVYLSSSTSSTSSLASDHKGNNQIYVRLDGSTNTIERQKIIKRFSNNDNIFIFLLTTKAGGVGLNLIAANHVILMDQDWNPHNDRQAEDRVHRLGQKNEVYIYRLCCKNTIEETILRCCKAKLHLDQAFGGNSDLLQTALIKDALSAIEMEQK